MPALASRPSALFRFPSAIGSAPARTFTRISRAASRAAAMPSFGHLPTSKRRIRPYMSRHARTQVPRLPFAVRSRSPGSVSSANSTRSPASAFLRAEVMAFSVRRTGMMHRPGCARASVGLQRNRNNSERFGTSWDDTIGSDRQECNICQWLDRQPGTARDTPGLFP